MVDQHAEWLREAAEQIATAGHNGWGNTCEDAAEHIDALEAELAALRAERDRDGELLDWLEQNPRHENVPYFDESEGGWGFPYAISNANGLGGGIGFHRFDSLRAAIDAAMRAEG